MTCDQLHADYVRLTGRVLDLDYNKRVFWDSWQKYCKHEPFTDKDLSLVIRFLKFQILKGERKPACLHFKNLICSPDYFQEDLLDAKQWDRQPTAAIALNSVLQATGRAGAVVKDQARSSAEILANREQGAAMLAQWRKENR